MPYVFNPFTGMLDYYRASSGTSGTDFHSGFYKIESSESFTVAENKQMTTFGMLTLDGELLVEGEYIVEI